MDAAQKGYGDFQDRHKEVIRGLTDRSITHRWRYVTTGILAAAHSVMMLPLRQLSALLGFLLREEKDQVGFRDDIETGALFHKDSGLLMVHVVGDFVD